MMKKLFNLSIALCVSMLMFACSDDKTTDDGTSGDQLCEFSTFGFYADDNKGVIALDYPGVISGTNISVPLPESIDKKALKARFTVTGGDVVKVGATIFESGVTPYNYSATVDFIVSDAASKMSKVYSVKIQKPVAKVWTEVGKLTKGKYDLKNSNPIMKLNPKDNLPYIVYCVEELVEATKTTKLAAAKWTGSAFTSLGSEAFSSKVGGSMDISFDSKGQPYVLYIDSDNGIKATVMAYIGTSWSIVGNPGFSSKANTSTGAALGIDATDKLAVMTVENSNEATNRSPIMSYYTGSTWETGISILNRPPVAGTSYATYKPTVKKFGNTLYFAVANNGKNGYSIYKYANGSITTLIEGGLIDPESSTTSIQDLSFDIATDGTIYFLSADDNGGTWQLRVFTYKDGDSAPKQFGSTIAHEVTSSSSYTIALDNNNKPYVAFNESKTVSKLQIINYDYETRNWTDPVTVSDIEIKTNPQKIFMEFTDNNTGYAGAISKNSPYEYILFQLADAK